MDPQGSGPFIAAAQWIQGTLFGTVATVAAVVAVGVVGLLMLTGRINWRYGMVVVLGSGLIDQSQKMTVAAMAMAEKKVCAHRS
jgi:type IV secretory pathway VirB2 component (pilin)